MQDNIGSLSQALGGRIHAIRAERGWRQDDVAAKARNVGLAWSRSVVAAIEAGRRQLSAEEFVLLPLVLDVEYDELLPETGAFRIGPEGTIGFGLVREILAGRAMDSVPSELDVPLTRAFRDLASRISVSKVGEQLQRYVQLWPEANLRQLRAAERNGSGEAEQRAARRLGTVPVVVSILAHRLWGRGLTAERDARVEARSADPAGLVALRGHVTRELVAELEPLVREFQEGG